MDVASPCPAIVEALQTAIAAAHARSLEGGKRRAPRTTDEIISRCPLHGLQLSRIKLGWRPGLLAPTENATMGEPLCISMRHAITGELLCELAGSEVGKLRVWELRLQFCPFFGWVFFHKE